MIMRMAFETLSLISKYLSSLQRFNTTPTKGVQAAIMTRLELVLAWATSDTMAPMPLELMKFDCERSKITFVPF